MVGRSWNCDGARKRGARGWLTPGRCVLIGMILLNASRALAAAPAADFAAVAELFGRHCVVCHSGAQAVLGLRLDSYAGVMAGSQRGPVVRPGDPAGSELLRRLRGDSQPRMPLTGPPYLTEAEVMTVSSWVAGGAHDGGAPVVAPARPPLPPPGAAVLFRDVAPILLQRCAKCHSAQSILGAPPEGLRLSSLSEVLQGGERVVVVPGHPMASELYRRVAGFGSPRMPFDGPPFLSSDEIRVLGAWIAQGARDDGGRAAPMPVGRQLRLTGTLDGVWSVDGVPLRVSGRTRIDKSPRPGDRVEMRGAVADDGSIVVDRLRRR